MPKLNKLLLTKKVEIIAVIVIALIQAFESFYGLIRYHYFFPSGGDMAAHLAIIRSILGGTISIFGNNYPPLYHLIVAFFAWSLHVNYITVTTLSVPILLVASGLAVWLLAKKLLGSEVGLLAYFLYALISLQPLQTVNDGGLPTLLGGHIILPFIIVTYYFFWLSRGTKKLAYFLGLLAELILLFAAHHLSTLIGLSVILATALPLTIWQLQQIKGWSIVRSLTVGAVVWILIIALSIYALLNLEVLRAARNLLELFLAINTSFPFVHLHYAYAGGSPVIPVVQYGQIFNGLIFQAGFVGSLWLLWEIIKKRRPLPLLMLVIWWWIMFIGSQQAWTGEPDRLVRDLSLPSSLLSAYIVIEVGKLLLSKQRPLAIAYSVLIALTLALGIFYKAQTITSYNYLVYVTQADKELVSSFPPANSSKPLGILDVSDLLQYYFAPQVSAGQVKILNTLPEAQQAIKNGQCVAVGYFQPTVWPPSFGSHSNLTTLDSSPGTVTKFISSDQEKVWYTVCPRG